jgi:hypothetical protein
MAAAAPTASAAETCPTFKLVLVGDGGTGKVRKHIVTLGLSSPGLGSAAVIKVNFVV